MSAAIVYHRAKRQQIAEGHRVINAAPISQEAKHLGHLFVDRFFALNWRHVSASCETLAKWLEENYAIRGCRYRLGSRGPAKCGPKRPTLSRETIRRYVGELLRAGLIEQLGGGRAVGARYAGKKPRGLRWWLRPSGLLWDALRGAYKAWRVEFARLEEPEHTLLPPEAVPAPPLSVASSLHLGSTAFPSEKMQKETAAPPSSLGGPTSTDALAPPRKNMSLRRPESGHAESFDAAHARFAAFAARVTADPPAKDRDPRD